MSWTTQLTRLTSAAGWATDREGEAVSASGDTVVVGAINSPAAIVYIRTSAGWSEQQRLDAPVGAPSNFGLAVAIDGDMLLVGGARSTASGKVYAYTRTAGVWTLMQTIVPADTAANDYFGVAIALQGTTLIVGASRAKILGVQHGAVYYFSYIAGLWVQQQKIVPANPNTKQFGAYVDLDANSLVVGDSLCTNGVSYNYLPAAWVFTRALGVWTEQQELHSGLGVGGGDGGSYAECVAIHGDTVLVGSPYLNVAGDDYRGKVYIYTRAAGVWSEEQQIDSPQGGGTGVYDSRFSFGASADFYDEDTVLIGSPYYMGVAWDIQPGAAHIFTRQPGGWSSSLELLPTLPVSDEQYFGHRVALLSDFVAIGAPLSRASVTSGSVYVSFVMPAVPMRLPIAGLYVDEIRGISHT